MPTPQVTHTPSPLLSYLPLLSQSSAQPNPFRTNIPPFSISPSTTCSANTCFSVKPSLLTQPTTPRPLGFRAHPELGHTRVHACLVSAKKYPIPDLLLDFSVRLRDRQNLTRKKTVSYHEVHDLRQVSGIPQLDGNFLHATTDISSRHYLFHLCCSKVKYPHICAHA